MKSSSRDHFQDLRKENNIQSVATVCHTGL